MAAVRMVTMTIAAGVKTDQPCTTSWLTGDLNAMMTMGLSGDYIFLY